MEQISTRNFGLLVDLKRNRSIDDVSGLKTNCVRFPFTGSNFKSYDVHSTFADILTLLKKLLRIF